MTTMTMTTKIARMRNAATFICHNVNTNNLCNTGGRLEIRTNLGTGYDGKRLLIEPEHKRLLLDLARVTIRRTLGGERGNAPPACPNPALLTPAGSFVSLHEMRTHRLRGCVGRMDASQPLWQSVHDAAIGVLGDPRFHDDVVRLEELPSLEIEISVLSPMRPAPTPMDFDPMAQGIYLIHQGRSGCFLPQVARETGWNREQLLSRLCSEKLELPPLAWTEPGARLLVFSTEIIGPEPF
jgi:AmmeMemoRadiSam system protein A